MTFGVLFTLLLAQTAFSLPSPTPNGSPSPTSTPEPCNHDAHVLKPEVPDVQGLTTESLEQPLATELQVTVAANGSVERIAISKSSSHLDFDMAAMRAARRSTYEPKHVDCKPVDGMAVFKATLTPDRWPP